MILKSTLAIFLLGIIASINGQQCAYRGQFTKNTFVQIGLVSLRSACNEYFFGSLSGQRTLTLTFRNSQINCNYGDIKVFNERRELLFSFCQRRSDQLSYNGVYLIVDTISQGYGILINTVLEFSISDLSGAPSTSRISSTTRSTSATNPPSVPSTSSSTSNPTPSASSVLPDTSECGLPEVQPDLTDYRIINGKEAIPNSWPWQVFITTLSNSLLCGASLINNQWLLTAAHCVKDGTRYQAYLGYHDISRTGYTQGALVSKIIKHPSYDSVNIVNDIALFKLATPVTFSKTIKPVCLPATANYRPGKLSIITGWGLTSDDGDTSNVLRQVTIPFMNQTMCSNIFGIRDYNKQFCAGGTDGKSRDSCQGDSGGSLVTKEGNNFVQAGVVSYGGSSCNGLGVYTNVNGYLNWITETIRNN